jgi:hypothetical protein
MRVSAASDAPVDVTADASGTSRSGTLDPAANASGFGALLLLLLQPTSVPSPVVETVPAESVAVEGVPTGTAPDGDASLTRPTHECSASGPSRTPDPSCVGSVAMLATIAIGATAPVVDGPRPIGGEARPAEIDDAPGATRANARGTVPMPTVAGTAPDMATRAPEIPPMASAHSPARAAEVTAPRSLGPDQVAQIPVVASSGPPAPPTDGETETPVTLGPTAVTPMTTDASSSGLADAAPAVTALGGHARRTGADPEPRAISAVAPRQAEAETHTREDLAPATFAAARRHDSIDAPEANAPAASLLMRTVPAETHVDAAPRVAAAERLTSPREPQVVEQVVRAARVVIRDGLTHMEVHLAPPSLGSVRVVAAEGGDGLGLTLAAERPETRALLLQAIPEMQAALAGHGIATASIAVATTFEPPADRRAPVRRESERQGRDPRSLTDRPARNPGAVATVDLTV